MKSIRKKPARTNATPAKSKAPKTAARPQQNSAAAAAPTTNKPGRKPRSGTKQEKVLAMLRSKDGATLAAMMKVTGWQIHSVRGFLSGAVKKRLGLTITSEVKDGERVYRIVDAKPSGRGRTSRGKGK